MRWLIFNASNAFSFRTFFTNVHFCTCFAPSLCPKIFWGPKFDRREILSFNLYENLEIFEIIFGIFEISLIFGGSVNWGQVSIKLSIRPLQVSGWPLVRFLTLSFDFFTFFKNFNFFFEFLSFKLPRVRV